MSNVETVQAIYAAFGRGDIAAILDRLSESEEWEYGVNSTDVPWLQPRVGRSSVAQYFQALTALEFTLVQVNLVAEANDTVIGLCDVDATVKATGRSISERDEVHIWQFGADGQVIRFRHRVDTHQQWLAWRQ